MRRALTNILLPAATGAVMIAIWYAIRYGLSEDFKFLLPTPDEIIGSLDANWNILGRAVYNTSQGALLGFGLAIVLSSLLALFMSLSSLVRISLYPYLMILQMTADHHLCPHFDSLGRARTEECPSSSRF